jgi:hypothetical protein
MSMYFVDTFFAYTELLKMCHQSRWLNYPLPQTEDCMEQENVLFCENQYYLARQITVLFSIDTFIYHSKNSITY